MFLDPAGREKGPGRYVAREEDSEYEEVMRINAPWRWMMKMKFEF
jgi:hypothetical protein